MLVGRVVRSFGRSPFEVLGVKPGASQTEIKSAFYKLVKQYHPDVNPGAAAKFKEIHSAYSLLTSTPNYKEEKPFDPGEDYQFRQQSRGNFYWSQTQQEEKREEEKKEKEPKKVEGRHTEKIVLAFVAGVLLMRFMLAEGQHQKGQYALNKPYEVSLDNYLQEVDRDDENFERYVKSRGLDQTLRRR